MVSSRPTSADQAMADFCTSTTPPSVTAERKAMMVMSRSRVRPATLFSGTMGAAPARRGRKARSFSIMDGQLPLVEHHARIGEAIEQRQFMCRQNDGHAQRTVELGKK